MDKTKAEIIVENLDKNDERKTSFEWVSVAAYKYPYSDCKLTSIAFLSKF